MQTHLHLIYEQLDLLVTFLIEETGALFAESNALNEWQRDDVHALAFGVDSTTECFLTVPQRLQDGYSLVEVGDDLIGRLQEVLERSSALLYDETLPTRCNRRLQQINNTGYDMLNIACEFFAL
jgi:hypothetical protein